MDFKRDTMNDDIFLSELIKRNNFLEEKNFDLKKQKIKQSH